MKRRGFLAGAACSVVALAGCAAPVARLYMSLASDADLAVAASRSVDDAPAPVRSVVASAVENGSATADERTVSLDPDRPVAYEGSYYEVTRSVVDRREERLWSLTVDYDPPPADAGPTVAYADLPAVDREALSGLVPPPDGPGSERPNAGVGTVYGPDGEAASVLVPDQRYEFVTHGGERYRVAVAGPRTVTVETYRYEAEQVADGAASYGEYVWSEYLFALDGLSDAERDIVESAVDGGYHADDSSDAFASLAARFRDHPGFGVDEHGGEWVVSYDGATYWAELHSESR